MKGNSLRFEDMEKFKQSLIKIYAEGTAEVIEEEWKDIPREKCMKNCFRALMESADSPISEIAVVGIYLLMERIIDGAFVIKELKELKNDKGN